MLKIGKLLQLDRSFPATNTLPNNLGDRYLYQHNPVFARIRDVVLSLHFTLDCRPTRLWMDYQAFPLLYLQTVLAERTIPYADNVSPLLRLLERRPELSMKPSFLLSNLRKNYILHESAHCIAEHVMSGQKTNDVGEEARKKRFVLSNLIAESFANSVEFMGSSFLESKPHIIFYLLNSYVSYDPEKRSEVSRSIELYGLKRMARFMVISFLYSNLGYEAVPKHYFEQIMELIFSGEPVPPQHRTLVQSLFNVSFTLNGEFRKETASTYFQLMGCQKEFESLRMYDFLSEGAGASFVLEVSEKLIDKIS